MKEQPFEMDESQRMDINDSELVHLLSKFYHSYQRKSYQEQFSECRDRIRNIDNLILNQQLVFDA
jgi:retron-type reverse transcriptase